MNRNGKKSNIVFGSPARDIDTDTGIKDVGLATDEVAKKRCCGFDCCDGNGIIRWRDQDAPHTVRIEYMKSGTKVIATEAEYEADKANGFA